MNEIISRNELTIEEHVQRIKQCLDRTRQSIFATVISIKECRDQVGDEVFQKEISTRLGMSPSTLNRWLSIGNSQFVMSHQDKVPTTFTGLYYLTQLEKKYSQYYSRDGLHRLEKLVQDGKIHENIQQTDIQDILNKISNQIKRRKKKEREKNIVDLVGGSIGSDDRSTTLDQLIDSRSMFRCVFVDLRKDLISRWGDQGFFETDIQSEFPLHELRTPSITEMVTCLIRVPMKKIDVGIKVLSSFGFSYRDTFVPSSKSDDMSLLDNQDILIRGERGGDQRLVEVHLHSPKTKDVLDFCESEFEGPFLVVFDEVNRSNWVSEQLGMYHEIKDQLRLIIGEQFPENEICLLLSGGSDSTLVGLVADELGKKVHSISFRLKDQTSWDFQTAKSTSNSLGWCFHEVVVPTNDPKIDFLDLVQNHKCKKKTELEVLYPFIHLMKKVKDLGFNKVLTGFSSPLPDGRRDSVKIKKDNFQYWEEMLSEEFDSSATKICVEFAKGQNILVQQPLNDRSIKEILVGKTWTDIHKPYWKSPWKIPYKDIFEKLGLLSLGKTPGLQVGGGIESYFAPLVNDPEINFKGYISGNTTQKLSQLIRLWSDIDPSTEVTPYPTRYNFEPYSLKDVMTASDREDFTVVSTFAGGGGSSTGYRLGGGKIRLVNEFIPEAVQTYKANYPSTPVEMIDIRKITRRGGRQYVLDWFKSFGIEEGEYDILDGSPPCSTFSTSRKRKKKIEEKNVKYSDTTQDRIGMLIHDFVYIANCTKPKVCVIENVPSIKSSDVFHHALNRLRRWGYKVNFKVLCSSNFGVPQRRNRLIAIAVRPDICRKVGIKTEEDILRIYPQGSIYEPTLRDDLEGVVVDPQQRNYLMMTSIKSSGYEVIKSIPKDPSYPMKLSDVDPDRTSDFNLVRASWYHPSPTLTQMGQQGGRGGIHHPDEDRVFTTDELKRLMGLPDDFRLTGTFNQKAERCGRMVTPHLYKHLSRSIYEKVILPSR